LLYVICLRVLMEAATPFGSVIHEHRADPRMLSTPDLGDEARPAGEGRLGSSAMDVQARWQGSQLSPGPPSRHASQRPLEAFYATVVQLWLEARHAPADRPAVPQQVAYPVLLSIGSAKARLTR
jgi:hypothetical protein